MQMFHFNWLNADEGEYLTILEGRTKDKTAREFVNKERKKMME